MIDTDPVRDAANTRSLRLTSNDCSWLSLDLLLFVVSVGMALKRSAITSVLFVIVSKAVI